MYIKFQKIDYNAIRPKRRIKKTKALALCSVFSALGVVLMYIGALTEVLDLTAAALASMLTLIIYIEIGGIYPYMVYAVTSLLSLLLLPQKFAALIYLLIAGYYPMLKGHCERLPKRFLEWAAKLAVFNAALTLAILASRFILLASGLTKVYVISLFLLGNFTFIVFDIALSMLVRLYFLKYRKLLKIEKLLK